LFHYHITNGLKGNVLVDDPSVVVLEHYTA